MAKVVVRDLSKPVGGRVFTGPEGPDGVAACRRLAVTWETEVAH